MLWSNGLTSRPRISSAFGPRKSPTPGGSTIHRGCDFTGYRTIHAIADGVVKVAGTPSGWSGGGKQVWVQHDGFFSKSMHMASTNVRVGDRVWAGSDLGVMGMTGTASGVHHHLEITLGTLHYSNAGQIDPVPFINDRLSTLAGGGSTAPADPTQIQSEEDDDMPTLISSGAGQNLVVGDTLIWFNSQEEVRAVKGAQTLEVAVATHTQIIGAFQRANGANLPVRVFVKGEDSVYLMDAGRISPLRDPATLAELDAKGGQSIAMSRAEVDNLLAS